MAASSTTGASSAQATPLSPSSEEYARVSYLLRLCLRSTNVKNVSIWVLGNPHLSVQFEKRTNEMLTLDSWVNCDALDDTNSVESVCQRGFTFPASGEGMVFETGNVRLERPDQTAWQLLLCKVGVGRSFVQDDPSARRVIPPGYDSLYLHKPIDADGDGKITMDEYEVAASHAGRSASRYHHEYCVLDATQVLPQYLVQFNFNEAAEGETAQICDVCESRPATLYCEADSARLCEECDEEMHSANKLVSRHVRTPLESGAEGAGQRLNIKSMCPQHPNLQVDFFCPLCSCAVCVHCKMVGSHSQGAAASHKLIGVGDAYDAALSASQREDPLLEGRQQAIRQHLRAIDAKLRAVTKNSATIEENIYQMLQEALFQLQDETQRKLSILLGEELELRRQLEQIDWVESFLGFQQESLPPTEFLAAWSRHTILRSELHNFRSTNSTARVLDEVQADIRLEGAVEVLTGSASAGPVAAAGRQAAGGDAAGAADGQPSSAFREQLFVAEQANNFAHPANSGLMSAGSNAIITSARHQLASQPGLPPAAAAAAAAAQQQRGGMGMGMPPPASPYPAAGSPGGAPDNAWTNSLRSQMGVPPGAQAGSPGGHMPLPHHVQMAMSPQGQMYMPGGQMPGGQMPGGQMPQGMPPQGMPPQGMQGMPGMQGQMPGMQGQMAGMPQGMPPQSPQHYQSPEQQQQQYQSPDQQQQQQQQHQQSPQTPASAMTQVAARFRQYSLRDQAARRKRALGIAVNPAACFAGSQIVTGEDAATLFFCLPFSGSVPETGLLYATWRDDMERSVRGLHQAVQGVYAPTVVLIRAGEYVLGGFATDSWRQDGSRFGSPKCFLFSITHDRKIPFHGRAQDAQSQTVAQVDQYGSPLPMQHDCLSGSPDSIQFGIMDLVLQGDFSNCFSELETSYGFGLQPGSDEAKAFLAGGQVFAADEVEVWQIA